VDNAEELLLLLLLLTPNFLPAREVSFSNHSNTMLFSNQDIMVFHSCTLLPENDFAVGGTTIAAAASSFSSSSFLPSSPLHSNLQRF